MCCPVPGPIKRRVQGGDSRESDLSHKNANFWWLMLDSSHGHHWLESNSQRFRKESWLTFDSSPLFSTCVLCLPTFFLQSLPCCPPKELVGDPEAIFKNNGGSRHGGMKVGGFRRQEWEAWGRRKTSGGVFAQGPDPFLNMIWVKMTQNVSVS